MAYDIASSADHYDFADNAAVPSNNGLLMCVSQLREILHAFGGKRIVFSDAAADLTVRGESASRAAARHFASDRGSET